tara:strand:- start:350 stop:556 length:207 start_codon:yes stop_codon:yes gene_type:complete
MKKIIFQDIKNKSIEEAKSEIIDILERLENNKIDLEDFKKDYDRLINLNQHIDNIFKDKLIKIKNTKK